MATRLYLPSSGAAAVNPAVTGWDLTTGFDRIRCVTAKSNTSFATKTAPEVTTSGWNSLARQYVSDAMTYVGSITGTVKGVVRSSEAAALADNRAQIRIRVVSNDGATFRGTLFDFDNSALSNEFVLTTLTNAKFPKGWTGSGATLTAVTAQAGDRLVIEIGHKNGTANEGLSTHDFGDTTASSDCAEDESSTAQNAPWVEFSLDLFAGGAAYPIPRVSRRRASW